MRFQLMGAARSRRLKEALLAAFAAKPAWAAGRLAGFSERDWRSVLFWLDINGMALYVLDRMRELGVESLLPAAMRDRLAENLRQNGLRTEALRRESEAVAEKLTRAEIPFALLKGMTLTPESVPNSELRFQTDLDFLIAERDGSAAAAMLRTLGYVQHSASSRTIELRAGEADIPDMVKMYRANTQRSLELHLLSRNGASDQLSRAIVKPMEGAMIHALAPADMMVQQALHLFKHLCGEHTRTSWVLEFWRHVHARRNESDIWNEVKKRAEKEPRGDIALGVSIMVAEDLFGEAAPEEVKKWTVARLPRGVRLWVERYARRLLLADVVGSKLYLILRQQLELDTRGEVRRLLFPVHLPLRPSPMPPDESRTARLKRHWVELIYFAARLRFHCIEGARYAIESVRWERMAARTELQ